MQPEPREPTEPTEPSDPKPDAFDVIAAQIPTRLTDEAEGGEGGLVPEPAQPSPVLEPEPEPTPVAETPPPAIEPTQEPEPGLVAETTPPAIEPVPEPQPIVADYQVRLAKLQLQQEEVNRQVAALNKAREDEAAAAAAAAIKKIEGDWYEMADDEAEAALTQPGALRSTLNRFGVELAKAIQDQRKDELSSIVDERTMRFLPFALTQLKDQEKATKQRIDQFFGENKDLKPYGDLVGRTYNAVVQEHPGGITIEEAERKTAERARELIRLYSATMPQAQPTTPVAPQPGVQQPVAAPPGLGPTSGALQPPKAIHAATLAEKMRELIKP